jgi:hypothetical protein
MRTIPLVLITFVALSLSTTGVRAGANGSWCANYGTGHSGIDCGFTSFEQCRATVSGSMVSARSIRTPGRVTGEAGPGT